MVPRTGGNISNIGGSKKKWYATWNWKTYTLAGISAVIVIVLSTFFFLLSSIWQKPPNPSVIGSVYSSVPAQDLAVLKDRTNILLIGVDERPDDPGRSDTIILVSVPSDDSYITIVSIPRDTMVWLPENGHYDKINHLYSYQAPSGAEFLKSAVERLLDLEIKGYVVVNLDGFVDLVDELGGVTIDIGDEPLYYYDPYQNLLIDLPSGVHHLDGKDAMGFVRYRDYDTADIGRIGAQQKFIQAFIDEFMAKKYDVLRLPGLITKGLSMVRTDLGLPDIMALAGSTLKVAEKPIERIQLIGDGVNYQDLSYYMLRYEENLELIAEHFFPENEREKYVREHLTEPWVRDYEYLRQRLYNEAVARWERQYYGWGEPEDAVTATAQVNASEVPETPATPSSPASSPSVGRSTYANVQTGGVEPSGTVSTALSGVYGEDMLDEPDSASDETEDQDQPDSEVVDPPDTEAIGDTKPSENLSKEEEDEDEDIEEPDAKTFDDDDEEIIEVEPSDDETPPVKPPVTTTPPRTP